MFIILVQKKLSENISSKEQQQLDIQLKNNQENRSLFEEYKKVWEASLSYQKDYHPDVETGLAKLHSRIRTKENELPIQTSHVRKLNTWYRVAAALLILVGAGLVWNYYGPETEQLISVTTNDNEQKVIQLSDGSTVTLNENSTFNYPIKFIGETRQLTLSGEAFFQVARDVHHPFVINSNQTETKVLGTSFNLRSYPYEQQTEVVVESGKVQFSGKSANQEYKFVVLEKDERGVYAKTSKKLDKTVIKSANHNAWKTKQLQFNNAKMAVVFEDIESFYDISIDRTNTNVLDCEFNSTFKNEPLDKVFENIILALELKVEKINNTSYVIIGGRKCI